MPFIVARCTQLLLLRPVDTSSHFRECSLFILNLYSSRIWLTVGKEVCVEGEWGVEEEYFTFPSPLLFH